MNKKSSLVVKEGKSVNDNDALMESAEGLSVDSNVLIAFVCLFDSQTH